MVTRRIKKTSGVRGGTVWLSPLSDRGRRWFDVLCSVSSLLLTNAAIMAGHEISPAHHVTLRRITLPPPNRVISISKKVVVGLIA